MAVEDIAQFAKMKEVDISTDEWMQARATLHERKVNEALADLFGQPAKKDWGGEPNDLFTANLLLEGRRRSAAFLLKGPSQFREMTLEMCGKRGDQIHRLAKSGADILVVQHSHQIGEAVRDTLKAMAGDRSYCFIDGQATYRILKAYGYI